MDPEVTRYLLALRERLEASAHGESGRLLDEAVAHLAVSRQTVYELLRNVGWTSGRRQRADAGTTRLPTETLEFIAAARQESVGGKGKSGLPTAVAMDIADANGLAVNVSVPHVRRLMRQQNLDLATLRIPRSTGQLRSEYPNHVHQLDPSLCIVYYMGGKQMIIREELWNKNKLDKVAKIKLKVWRYVRYDHYSGSLDVKYYEAAGENQASLFDFLMHTWGRHDSRLNHGVPSRVLWDKGSANTAHGVQRLLDGLGIQHETHGAGHAWAKGGVENGNNLIETQFESRLRFEPVETVEQLNASAWAWSRAWHANALRHVDGRVQRAAGRFVRDELWAQITPEQLILLPDREVCQYFLAGREETRDVVNLRISYRHPEIKRSAVYSLRPWAEELHKGEKVSVTPLLLREGAVRIQISRIGRDPLVIEVMPQTGFDGAGRTLEATVFGQYQAQPVDATEAQVQKLVAKAWGEGTTRDQAEAQRGKGARPFAQANGGKGLVAHSHLESTRLPLHRKKTGTEMNTPALAAQARRVELAPVSFVAAAKSLRHALGRNLQTEESAWLKSTWPQGVPAELVDQLPQLMAERDSIHKKATGTHDASAKPLRVLK